MHEESGQRHIVNKTYDEIRVGDFASLTRTLMPEDVKLFAVLTGDINPSASDLSYSESGMFREVMAHGMWSGSLISTLLGTQFPGPGTILVDESLHFTRPVSIGDTITITLTAKQKFDHNRHVILDCLGTNQENLQVVRGTAEVLAPTEKISRIQSMHAPAVSVDDKHERYQSLLAKVRGLEPIPTAVAHPCDKESLKGPVIAFQEASSSRSWSARSRRSVPSRKSSVSTCTASASSTPGTAMIRRPSPCPWCVPATPKP